MEYQPEEIIVLCDIQSREKKSERIKKITQIEDVGGIDDGRFNIDVGF